MNITFRTGLLAMVSAFAAAGMASTYKITITNLGDQPLSPLYFAASDASFDIFKSGSAASLGIKRIAEGGATADMLAITNAAGSAVGGYGVVGTSPLLTGVTRTQLFDTDAAHSMFSFACMLGKTNDGFIGESVSSMGLSLLNGPLDFIVLGSRAWDAGTELNTQNAADLGFKGGFGNPQEAEADRHVRFHAGIQSGFGDSWQDMPAWSASSSVAHLRVEAVPEPGSLVAIAAGLGFIIRRRSR